MMNKRLLIYISALLTLFMFSCTDEVYKGVDQGGIEGERTIVLDISAGDAENTLSRSVSTESGEIFNINNLWVGIFDSQTGLLLGKTDYNTYNQTFASGVVLKEAIKIDVRLTGINKKAYIVAVANYDGVTTHEGTQIINILNGSGITWSDVVNINIDTDSAYKGDKGQNDYASSPFLVGFFQEATSLNQNPKIDQFRFGETPTAVYPSAAASGMELDLSNDVNETIYVTAGALSLRRLVSTIKVDIDAGDFEVSRLRYKRFNMPKVVWMTQRRTDINVYPDFETWQRNSPNAADAYLTASDYENKNKGFPYDCDDDWIETDKNNFEFQHFENKRFGFGDISSHADRERQEDGHFVALCPNKAYYNDYGSYFLLNANLVNKKTGESADVIYTIHEGLCNTEDGKKVSDYGYPGDEFYDFGSFRNTVYTYKIKINGFEDIKVNVTSGPSSDHSIGQEGNLWTMSYVNGNRQEGIGSNGAVYRDCMNFSPNADLGFRLYGFDSRKNIIDICYNMPKDLYDHFVGLWPVSSNTVYIDNYDDLKKLNIDATLLNAFMITDQEMSPTYNIIDYIDRVNSMTKTDCDISVSAYNLFRGEDVGYRKYMRALYLFDNNDVRYDEDRCCSIGTIYAAEQYPAVSGGATITMTQNDMIWSNQYYGKSTSDPIWTSCQNSVVPLMWYHDERIQGYELDVFNLDGELLKTVKIPDALRYVEDYKNRKIFHYDMSTVDLPAGGHGFTLGANNYSLTIRPIVDLDEYKGATELVIKSSTAGPGIRVCPEMWDFSNTKEWKDALSGTSIYFRGLLYSGTSSCSKSANARLQIPAGNATNNNLSFYAARLGTLNIVGSGTVVVGYTTDRGQFVSLGTFTLSTASERSIDLPVGAKPRKFVIYGTTTAYINSMEYQPK